MEAKELGVFPILDLPAELHLQVYKWVHLQHPITNERQGPHGSLPYVCKRVVAIDGAASEEEEYSTSKAASLAEQTPLLSPHRPWAAIPTALLQTNRQIYAEAHTLTLQENEFDFARLSRTRTGAGSPGLWVARDCTLRLLPEPWQRDALRYARLEVTAWDLVLPGGMGRAESALGRGAAWATTQDSGRELWVVREGEEPGVRKQGQQEQEETVPLHVVLAGLRLLKALRRLEVELALSSWDAERKLAWCKRMGDALNENKGGCSRPVEVICVEPL